MLPLPISMTPTDQVWETFEKFRAKAQLRECKQHSVGPKKPSPPQRSPSPAPYKCLLLTRIARIIGPIGSHTSCKYFDNISSLLCWYLLILWTYCQTCSTTAPGVPWTNPVSQFLSLHALHSALVENARFARLQFGCSPWRSLQGDTASGVKLERLEAFVNWCELCACYLHAKGTWVVLIRKLPLYFGVHAPVTTAGWQRHGELSSHANTPSSSHRKRNHVHSSDPVILQSVNQNLREVTSKLFEELKVPRRSWYPDLQSCAATLLKDLCARP